ncbi:hypothetical protein EV141_1490 [Microcella putealis]|uniref:Uncharacterized protein n=1 Tax=Microcella putealis TaxID=337005 RepID=A0A4V2EX01_9MICO|nr:hypothetical protein [Microcella putealis]RZS57770.1 hypothetical protein EV141_1490 [Microcella putealis]TQM24837.1 hypothetical protein BJ957_1099 [Microcella putealis]
MAEPIENDEVRAGLGKAADEVGRLARSTSAQVAEQAGELRDAAGNILQKLTTKKLDPYEEAIAEYNGAFTAMNDSGLSLLRQRERSTDLIDLVEFLVNSIANTPKSFEKDFEDINFHKAQFVEVIEFARKDLEAARASAIGAGTGFAAGAAVASMAPTAAMWAATTFGVASTGTAISTLSGAAATNAALAWLGGGALTVGGGGTAAGSALLALAGPIGWTVAGATLLVSVVLFTKKKVENRDAKQESLVGVKQNTALVRGIDAQIDDLLRRTSSLRELLLNRYRDAITLAGADFLALSAAEQSRLATLVNNAKAAAVLLRRTVNQQADDE